MPATEAADLWRPVNGTRGDKNRIISMPVEPETGAIVRKVLEEIVSQPNVTLAGAARNGPCKDRCPSTATPSSTAKTSTDSSTPERENRWKAGIRGGTEIRDRILTGPQNPVRPDSRRGPRPRTDPGSVDRRKRPAQDGRRDARYDGLRRAHDRRPRTGRANAARGTAQTGARGRRRRERRRRAGRQPRSRGNQGHQCNPARCRQRERRKVQTPQTRTTTTARSCRSTGKAAGYRSGNRRERRHKSDHGTTPSPRRETKRGRPISQAAATETPSCEACRSAWRNAPRAAGSP